MNSLITACAAPLVGRSKISSKAKRQDSRMGAFKVDRCGLQLRKSLRIIEVLEGLGEWGAGGRWGEAVEFCAKQGVAAGTGPG
jgi:hypothetical protein